MMFTFYYIVMILIASNLYMWQCCPKMQKYVSYRRARFTPPVAKYLILDDFHFRIDPQIINYNGLSFHTSMGLSELVQAAFCIFAFTP
jgi:hypothetical protein